MNFSSNLACTSPILFRYRQFYEQINNFEVIDKTTFVEFLKLLRNDFLNNPKNWENKTLPDFLKALSSYTEDIQGYYDNLNMNIDSNESRWSLFADHFKGAKINE